MRLFKQFCAACVLTLALTLSAFAGEMSAGITAPPPPPQQAVAQGDMGAGVTGEMPSGLTAIDPVTEIALNLLQSLLSLF